MIRNYLFGAAVAVLCFAGCEDPTPTPVLPALSIADFVQAEGNTNNDFQITVTLSAASEANVVVTYATVAGTAVAGADFVEKTDGELVFAAGETTKTIAVRVVGDEVNEGDEQFEIVLLNPVNATLADSRAKVGILNDDSHAGLVIPTTGYTSPTTYAGYTLVWEDDFTTFNNAAWTHEIGTGNSGWGNNELQYYRAENTFIHEGNLVIEALQQTFGGSSYTSSRLITKDKKSFKYGRVDIRAVLPKGQGLWPALWMLGDNIGTVGWPACGEIDIMEIIGNQPNKVHGTAHWESGGHAQYGGSKTLPSGDFSDEFHVFSIEWNSQKIKWLLDGVQYHEIDLSPADLSEFHEKFFFIFNVAVGGNWPGNPDATTSFPQRMIVDYIRVFQ